MEYSDKIRKGNLWLNIFQGGGYMKTKWYIRPIVWLPASFFGIFILILCYLAYFYVPPEDRVYQSPYLQSVASDFIDTDEFRIHYTHAGAGDPLILIHGSCGWLYGYRHNIPALAKHFSVYAIDMPGNGYTVPICKAPEYDLDMMSRAILGFMNAKEIEKAALIGHSSGGGWTLHFASRHPERVDKLVLIDSNGFNIPEKLTFKLFYIPVVGELFSNFFTIDDVRKGYQDAFYNTSLVDDTMIHEAMTPLTFYHNRRAQYLSIRNQDWAMTEKALPDIDIPALIIWGKNDKYLDYNLAYRFERILPKVKVVVIDNCGHSAHEEQPGKVNQLMLEFLGGNS
jgi:pimeloyl-ACP methyl ester carboxylesterase